MVDKKTKALLASVLSEITPSDDEVKRQSAVASSVVSGLNKALFSVKARAELGGSFRKRTQLRGSNEVDVFVLFDYKKYFGNDKAVSDVLAGVLKRIFPDFIRLHGSRDYFQVLISPYTLELIPILDLKRSSQSVNITDVSPFHARWVNRHSKGLVGEIRLAKAFCAGQGVYGAESHIRGFSGYACEVLVIHYGSFIKLLRAASGWAGKVVIDTEGFYRRKNPILFLNRSKTLSPVILIDPVQPGRNVTAALDDGSFSRFVKASGAFLSNPNISFFREKTVTKDAIVRSNVKHARLLLVEVVPESNKADVMGAAVRLRYERIRAALSESHFVVRKCAWQFDGKKGLLWFVISTALPEPYEVARGPEVSDRDNSIRFRKRHKPVFVRGGRLYAKVRRRFLTPEPLVVSAVRNPEFMRRIAKVSVEWFWKFNKWR